jgi:hypothetical protein
VDNILLDIMLWVVLIGFFTFIILYGLWNKPWMNQMGRHILFFMGGLAWAFGYAIVSEYVEDPWRTKGWILVLVIIAFLVWWRVAILVSYQLEARRRRSDVK